MYYVLLLNVVFISYFKDKTLMAFQFKNETSHNIILKKNNYFVLNLHFNLKTISLNVREMTHKKNSDLYFMPILPEINPNMFANIFKSFDVAFNLYQRIQILSICISNSKKDFF